MVCWSSIIVNSLYRVSGIIIGLIGHIKTHFPATMYRLYLVLKDRDTPPTDEEFTFASGKKHLDSAKAAEYLIHLEKGSLNIVQAFKEQNERVMVSL